MPPVVLTDSHRGIGGRPKKLLVGVRNLGVGALIYHSVMGASPVEMMCFPTFERAAGAAGVFELRLRLLCDSTPATAKKVLKSNLSEVLSVVIAHFGHHLSETERARLDACVKMRNKVFHQELSRQHGHLVALGEELSKAAVWQANLETGAVSETQQASTADGKIYGWLWVGVQSGAFDKCVELFQEGGDLLRKARDAETAAQIERDR
jgi:hypothetical protein